MKRVQGSGFRVQGSEFGVPDLGFGVPGSGVRGQGLGVRSWLSAQYSVLSTRTRRAAARVGIAAMVLLATTAYSSLAAEKDNYRQKQQSQEKARGLARELVQSVLDIQLRQLKENGMEKVPVYADIRDMRVHVDALVKDQMEAVVELLVKAQDGTKAERLARFNEARDKIRDIVVQLMAERQKLHKRLQIARIAAQVHQLIGMETKVYNVTRSLPDEKPEERQTERAVCVVLGRRSADPAAP